ncbi:MAG: type III-B CRISPR module RAMP protein Cmr6 [Candidatus Wallbacteria bacterium]|nr:type III-B CRISPR module RAMP protein Cmr6 [Candidatus Wallbacteria bacterium]
MRTRRAGYCLSWIRILEKQLRRPDRQEPGAVLKELVSVLEGAPLQARRLGFLLFLAGLLRSDRPAHQELASFVAGWIWTAEGWGAAPARPSSNSLRLGELLMQMESWDRALVSAAEEEIVLLLQDAKVLAGALIGKYQVSGPSSGSSASGTNSSGQRTRLEPLPDDSQSNDQAVNRPGEPLSALGGKPLEPARGLNCSLDFERHVHTYVTTERHRIANSKDSYQGPLQRFVVRFSSADGRAFQAELTRRANERLDLLAGRGNRREFETTSRLVVGLGLPHPSETGLFLDWKTGLPVIPGSSVKGLLRSMVDIADDNPQLADSAQDGVWFRNRETLAGWLRSGESEDGESAAGSIIFFDAVPASWPQLELDVMTPHLDRGIDASEDGAPSDADDPNPVPFVTVKAGTRYVFRIARAAGSPVSEDWPQYVWPCLAAALQSLGAGAKTAVGYGRMISV